jgi:hypothetical protein
MKERRWEKEEGSSFEGFLQGYKATSQCSSGIAGSGSLLFEN